MSDKSNIYEEYDIDIQGYAHPIRSEVIEVIHTVIAIIPTKGPNRTMHCYYTKGGTLLASNTKEYRGE